MKNLLVLALVLFVTLVIGGCGGERADTANPKDYTKNGLRFQLPGNWRVTEDNEEAGVRYLFVEEPGDALVVIQLVSASDAANLTEYAESFSASAKEETPLGNIASSGFSAVRTVGGYEILTEKFTISLAGQTLPHTREFRRKTFDDTACFVTTQVAIEDQSNAIGGFQQVVGSLQYNKP